MNKQITVLLITSFIAAAVFGFIWMGCDMDGCGRVCLAKIVAGECPFNSGLGLAIFHSQAFQGFSLAILSALLMLALIAAMALLTATLILALALPRSVAPVNFNRQFHDFTKQALHRWLCLHEKRDPALV